MDEKPKYYPRRTLFSKLWDRYNSKQADPAYRKGPPVKAKYIGKQFPEYKRKHAEKTA